MITVVEFDYNDGEGHFSELVEMTQEQRERTTKMLEDREDTWQVYVGDIQDGPPSTFEEFWAMHGPDGLEL